MLLTAGNETGMIGGIIRLPQYGFITKSIKNNNGIANISSIMNYNASTNKNSTQNVDINTFINFTCNGIKINNKKITIGNYIFILETSS